MDKVRIEAVSFDTIFEILKGIWNPQQFKLAEESQRIAQWADVADLPYRGLERLLGHDLNVGRGDGHTYFVQDEVDLDNFYVCLRDEQMLIDLVHLYSAGSDGHPDHCKIGYREEVSPYLSSE